MPMFGITHYSLLTFQKLMRDSMNVKEQLQVYTGGL